MKQKISISIEESKINQIQEFVDKGIFRNKSHAFEKSIDNLLDNIKIELNTKINVPQKITKL